MVCHTMQRGSLQACHFSKLLGVRQHIRSKHSRYGILDVNLCIPQPSICENFLRRKAPGDDLRARAHYEALRISCDRAPRVRAELEWPRLDVADDLRHAFAVEGQVSGEQGVQDDSAAPHVALLIVGGFAEDLGSHVVRGSADCLQVGLPGCESTCQAEVNQLDRALGEGSAVLLDQEILEFEVTVHQALAMHVVHRLHDLHENVPCLRFAADPPLLRHSCQEFAAPAQFHDDADLSLLHEPLVDPDNVRMVQGCMDLHLSIQLGGVGHIICVHDLEHAFSVAVPASCQAHGPEAALPEHFAYLVAICHAPVWRVHHEAPPRPQLRRVPRPRCRQELAQACDASATRGGGHRRKA
mmetsp:Transcript_143080/g.363153  ORF Transcript_143080/g.363153 Transcript_143080/m.363153 type:complete len:355 (+) Transcript_143080:100-1164(+)